MIAMDIFEHRHRDEHIDIITDTEMSEAFATAMGGTDDSHAGLPTYTESDEGDLMARVEGMQALDPEHFVLPFTKLDYQSPLRDRELTPEEYEVLDASSKLQREIIDSFYDAITKRRPEIVTHFITQGLVSPDVTLEGKDGYPHKARTPLLAAVAAGDASMIRLLVSLGSTVELVGFCVVSENPRYAADLTPLQLAAGLGRLSLVKVLREEFGADDAFVAPKGETALWLARRFRHREIVDYLPAVKAGGWVRFRSSRQHEIQRLLLAMRRSCMLNLVRWLVWGLPKAILWDLPQEAWKKREKIMKWCKRQVVKFPGRAKRAVKALGRGIKKTPEAIKKIVEEIAKTTWKFIKAIPPALAVLAAWVANGARAVGTAVTDAVKAFFGVIHTAMMAVLEWFSTITLQDVINGVTAVLEAVFVRFPKAVWSFVGDFAEVAWKVAKKFPLYLGVLLYGIVYVLWWMVKWPAVATWTVLSAVGRVIARMFDEIIICFDPKRM
ncbi:hypothetical protein B0T11DRAFT_78479 [Plectosphaerella cucumerina]|uniref:Ankyrin repeat protein n=1 Tax=Plectosphaerella cucumerina TaxID=40658 RepID=A0A8K0X2N8_9PEZI|nr:hypothetical protein B0T11DRAFT_78479 [Plectosphaerella cucumerina]